jgi:hypothetical protein
MQVLLISIVCLFIITLVFVVFPSSMTIKGRLIIVIFAFVLSNIGLAIQYLYENFLLSLGSLLLLVLLLPLFMQKRSLFFFKEEIHSEYITTFTAKDMNKPKAELDEDEEIIFTEKSEPSLEKEDNETFNPIEAVEEEIDPEVDFPLEKKNEGSEDIVILQETENLPKQDDVKEWSYAKVEPIESSPKEDYWKNDNVVVRENSIEAFLEEIHASKKNEDEEDQLEEIEEKPNRRYLERLEKIRILDNSDDSPKDNN